MLSSLFAKVSVDAHVRIVYSKSNRRWARGIRTPPSQGCGRQELVQSSETRETIAL